MILYPRDRAGIDYLAKWASERINQSPSNVNYSIAGVDSNGDIKSVACYYGYDNNNIFMAYACDNPKFAHFRLLYLMLEFPFLSPYNCKRVTALVAETNMRASRLCKLFGFQDEGVLRDYPLIGSKTLILGLTLEDFYGGPNVLFIRSRRQRTELLAGTDISSGIQI